MGYSQNLRRSITNLFIFLSFFMGMVYLGLQAHQKAAANLANDPMLKNPSSAFITDVRVNKDSSIEIEYTDSTVQTLGVRPQN